MGHEILTPTEYEVRQWMTSILQHSFNVEYFLERFDLGGDDPERPHDLVGAYNKFEWDVVKGLALQYREPKVDFDIYIAPARELHRQQYHHRKWNGAGGGDMLLLKPGTSVEDMWVGAIDAICSHREDRGYQGGIMPYDEIMELNSAWMREVIPKMRAIERPQLELIASLHDFPNIGLNDEMYGRIVTRTTDAVAEMRGRGFKL